MGFFLFNLLLSRVHQVEYEASFLTLLNAGIFPQLFQAVPNLIGDFLIFRIETIDGLCKSLKEEIGAFTLT